MAAWIRLTLGFLSLGIGYAFVPIHVSCINSDIWVIVNACIKHICSACTQLLPEQICPRLDVASTRLSNDEKFAFASGIFMAVSAGIVIQIINAMRIETVHLCVSARMQAPWRSTMSGNVSPDSPSLPRRTDNVMVELSECHAVLMWNRMSRPHICTHSCTTHMNTNVKSHSYIKQMDRISAAFESGNWSWIHFPMPQSRATTNSVRNCHRKMMYEL